MQRTGEGGSIILLGIHQANENIKNARVCVFEYKKEICPFKLWDIKMKLNI